MNNYKELQRLGWQPFFQQQMSLSEYETTHPARVIAHDRNRYTLASGSGELISLNITSALPSMTVGDWALITPTNHFLSLLDRKSLFARRSAGSKVEQQLIAANVETLFIVSSLNHDFNLSRIERYLVMANEAGVEPILVLTKLDLANDNDKESVLKQLAELDARLRVECVNALDIASCTALKSECTAPKTVALIGSSGVGKSSLVNTLLMSNTQSTKEIREDDSKGRHTTTARSIHFMPSGGVIIDTPGMRELQLAGCEEGVDSTFDDISTLASACKFSDCKHEYEKGCAVLDAINSGAIDPRRLTNYRKLKSESLRNSMALHEKKAKEKRFSKMVNSVIRGKKR